MAQIVELNDGLTGEGIRHTDVLMLAKAFLEPP